MRERVGEMVRESHTMMENGRITDNMEQASGDIGTCTCSVACIK